MADTDTPVPRIPVMDIQLPADQEAGVFADYAGVWHTESALVVDFQSARAVPFEAFSQDGQPIMVLPTKVVARVRLNPAKAIEFIRVLSARLDMWEAEQKAAEAATGVTGHPDNTDGGNR